MNLGDENGCGDLYFEMFHFVSVTAANRGAFFNNDEFNNVLSRARLDSLDNSARATTTANTNSLTSSKRRDTLDEVRQILAKFKTSSIHSYTLWLSQTFFKNGLCTQLLV